MSTFNEQRKVSVGIIGAGAAGLITAHTLLQDGFTDVQIITKDKSVGGVWARERAYPGLFINNVHGEYNFSPLRMPPPVNSRSTGGRLSGADVQKYLETFAETFLHGKIKFKTEVFKVQRDKFTGAWSVGIINNQERKTLHFDRIVLCTGGCSQATIPTPLSPSSAALAGFHGLVVHSSQIANNLSDILGRVKPDDTSDAGHIIVVGGGKSAQDLSAYLAGEGRKVTVVFDKTDAILASAIPLPAFIRKSRLLSILSPHIELRTRLERFLHRTWFGSKIVHFVWNKIASTSFDALAILPDSPLRRSRSLFWGIRTNDIGAERPNGFFALVKAGKINLMAPARVERFGEDGTSLVLDNGEQLPTDIVILATGFSSSWNSIFDDATIDELGLRRHTPLNTTEERRWDYVSLGNSPMTHSQSEQWASSIYRGIVPAKNIDRRDFAINGAIFTTHPGYVFETVSHWISSYFLGDAMRVPSSPAEAYVITERNAAWTRQRYPNMLLWANESYSSALAFWTWPQLVDELLEDMGLRYMRSGGNWLTWPFKVIDVQEIAGLGEERRARRERGTTA